MDEIFGRAKFYSSDDVDELEFDYCISYRIVIFNGFTCFWFAFPNDFYLRISW
jgi:hypothetical protein